MGATIRERLERVEEQTLSPWATLSKNSQGRKKDEDPCPVRTAFMVDRDRIVHSKSFRRLMHKTQVFLSPEQDHYRTRLTHTLEVAQIARTIAKALGLNEVLTEAIALGHDLGHTPFGHAGEAILSEITGRDFSHERHSIRVVDILEKKGMGLNLTYEVKDGILRHSKGRGDLFDPKNMPKTLEGEVVRISDIIAYVNHDLDDAIRAKIITLNDVPEHIINGLGRSHGERIDTLVKDVIKNSNFEKDPHIRLSGKMHNLLIELREFLYEKVYLSDEVITEFKKAKKIMKDLFDYFRENPNMLQQLYEIEYPKAVSFEKMVVDFIAGMTDRYIIKLHNSIFLPKPWR